MGAPLLQASTLVAPGTVALPFYIGPEGAGVKLDISYTAEGGAGSTLDAKLQVWDSGTQAWEDLTDSAGNAVAFAQFTGISEDSLTIYPGLIEKLTGTNRHYNGPLPQPVRLLCTVGTTSVTFAVSMVEL